MDFFQEIQARLLKQVLNTRFTRPLEHQIDWSQRLIALKGARGVGKTTVLLKRIANELASTGQGLYASLDSFYFSENRLYDLADDFYKSGGKYLFLDEVHKYPNWSLELKNIYDSFPDLHLIVTSSSMLQLVTSEGDLSRRMTTYELRGLSFREYLNLETGNDFPAIGLSELLKNHVALANDVANLLRPLQYFTDYLQHGYYPYYLEGQPAYHQKLLSAINTAIEVDLPFCYGTEIAATPKIKQLLRLVAVSPPMQPNVSKLSSIMGVSRGSVLKYFDYLSDASLFNLLKTAKSGYSVMAKPSKVYLDNTNLGYAIAPETVNVGSQRETFFFNQIAPHADVYTPVSGDFLVNDTAFEIGGKKKGFKQVSAATGYVAADGIEVGFGRKIPLWLFGFLA